MDFIESIFSIVPLLMIVLFFVRLAAVSKKKNRPKPLNTIPPAGKTEPVTMKDSVKPKKASGLHSRIESLLHGELPKTGPITAAKKIKPEVSTLPADTKNPKQNYYPSGPKGLNSLDKIKNRKLPEKDILSEKISRKNISREKLNSLPELKRAVIWSEILGKPKGLD